VGCLLADPTPGGGGAAAIEQLAKEHGYLAVLYNPDLWPEGEKMTNEVCCVLLLLLLPFEMFIIIQQHN
jgi:hypothetical protein